MTLQWKSGGGTDLPAGGTTNQVLAKLSDTDNDAGWKSISELIGDAPFAIDTIWEGNAAQGQQYEMLKPYTDYDMLIVATAFDPAISAGETFSTHDPLLVEKIVQGTTYAFSTESWICSIKFNDATHFTEVNAQRMWVSKIYGIKFGIPELTQNDLDYIASKFPTQSYVGRWEKIGEWTGNQTGLTLDLDQYNMVSFVGRFNHATQNVHAVNGVTVNVKEFQRSGELSLRSYVDSATNATLTNTAANTWNLTLNGTAYGAVLYGYKEYGMTDADKQEIAQQLVIPDGGYTGQALTKASDADFDYEWKDPAPRVIRVVLNTNTGAITCYFSSTPTVKKVYQLYNNNEVAGTWNDNVFTPTNINDTVEREWQVVIE